MMKKLSFIIISTVLACFSLFIVEQLLDVSYLIKTGSKICLFLLIPIIYLVIYKEKIRFKVYTSEIKYGLLIGLASLFIVLIAYYFFQSLIDSKSIISDLKSSSITASNFILIGLYITFGNSFLEEFFFRGFIFLKIYDAGYKKFAYLFSAGLFAIYHIAIFVTWFEAWITLLALIGLFAIGIVFNLINLKSRSFINSWIIHICADTAVILIGLSLFGII